MADGEYIDPKVKQELESRLESDPELSVALYIQTAMKNILHQTLILLKLMQSHM